MLFERRNLDWRSVIAGKQWCSPNRDTFQTLTEPSRDPKQHILNAEPCLRIFYVSDFHRRASFEKVTIAVNVEVLKTDPGRNLGKDCLP